MKEVSSIENYVNFTERRTEMREYLQDNFNFNPRREQGKLFIKTREHNFCIDSISQEKEFERLINYQATNDPFIVDNDREINVEMFSKLLDYIIESNDNDIIPGFIFLQSKTDFTQVPLKKRKEVIINKTGFNKQKLQQKNSSIPFLDRRILQRSENVVWSISQFIESYDTPTYVRHKGDYFRELNYYNTNKGVVEVNAYKNISDPKLFQNKEASIQRFGLQKKPDGEWDKKSKWYTRYVIERNIARYHKEMYNLKQRSGKVRGRGGIEWDAKRLNIESLLPHISIKPQKKEYFLATIK